MSQVSSADSSQTAGAKVALNALLLAEIFAVAWLVLNPSPATPTSAVSHLRLWLSSHGVPAMVADGTIIEFALNVALFVPIGATLRMRFPRVPLGAWACAGVVTAGSLELMQHFFLSARSATWRDVWANSLGLVVGAAAMSTACRLLRRSPAGSHSPPNRHNRDRP